MSWSDWQQNSLGRYQTNNLNPTSTGKNSLGLPNPVSVPPSFPISDNCSYILYGKRILWGPNGIAAIFEGGDIPLYTQVMYQGKIFYTISIGYPIYRAGVYTTVDGVVGFSVNSKYGHDKKITAYSSVVHSVFGSSFYGYASWDNTDGYEIVFESFYTVPLGGESCEFRFPDTSLNPRLYLGTAAPPPPPPKNMSCCDCNTIATIMAENTIAELKQHEATREHIDRRTIEALREINKMLQGMNFNMNLQPIIDRLNELEANLWNGLKAGG
ncbi:hypothetical protein [Microcoleus sp. B4-C1]|uniref:hypothetical protein n=1 Tax=Microcoleus sp. B4-C1 TaxID=2818660 RepID=UPI002FD487F9